MGDINKRRGRILGTEQVEDKCIVTCEVPEIEILEYAQDLRSLTQAKGFFSSEFVRYEEVPFDQTSKIIEQAKKQD